MKARRLLISSIEDKFNALLKTPHPDFSNPAAWRPAWLIGRPWGMDNGDGTYGIPELWDVLMMLGEFGVDVIDHPDVPKKGPDDPYSGWWDCRELYTSRMNYPDAESALRAMLELGDDFYSRLRLPNGDLQVPWRTWFGAGPGYNDHWAAFDLFRTDRSARMYNEEYGPAHQELPPPLKLEETQDRPPVDIVQKLEAALNAGNVEALLALYQPNAVHVTAQRTIQGRDELRIYYGELLGSLLPNAQFDLTTVVNEGATRHVSWNAASPDGGRVTAGQDTLGLRRGLIQYHGSLYRIES